MKKPMIGVTPIYDYKKESAWMLTEYFKGIEEVGGIPVMLPITTDKEALTQMAKTFDGFLFTGGDDLDPSFYQQENRDSKDCYLPKDQMEKILFEEVLKEDKPILGICRGCQIINVFCGGTLYQDIEKEKGTECCHKQTTKRHTPIHSVKVEKHTILWEIAQSDSIEVNSLHHQGIKELGKDLIVSASAPDGLIEAVEMPDKRFVLGVQWHPELMYTVDELNVKVLCVFLDKCGTKSK